MSKSFSAQALAFSLAVFVTGSLLASVSGVADRQYQGAAVAQAAAADAAANTTTIATQQVVIVGKRIARA